MRLLLLHPKVACRNCSDCLAWQYNEETGEREKIPGTDRDRPRPNPDLVPCRTPVGCPKGSPDAGLELTERNWVAYEHYRECRAIGRWPTNHRGEPDAIVRRNAAIIANVEQSIERSRRQRFIDSVEAVVRSLAVRR